MLAVASTDEGGRLGNGFAEITKGTSFFTLKGVSLGFDSL